jgi:hypothetical protein
MHIALFVRNLTLLELCTYLVFIHCHSSVVLSGPQKGDCTFEYAYSFIFIFILFLPLVLWFTDGLTFKGNSILCLS